MTGLNLTKCSVSDFLEHYQNAQTRYQYKCHLKVYFCFIYPELKKLNPPELFTELDALSVKYDPEYRDIRKDLVSYTNQIQNFAPKTRIHKLNAIFRFLEDNGTEVPKQLRRNLIGLERDTISEEYVPKPGDIKRVIEHLNIADKTLVLVLLSSGMRVGECLKLRLKDIDLNHKPVRVTLPAHITKTKKKRVTFISEEAKQVLVDDWLPYRLEYRKRSCAKRARI